MGMMGLLFVAVFFGDLFALYYSGCWFALRKQQLLGGVLEDVWVCLSITDHWICVSLLAGAVRLAGY